MTGLLDVHLLGSFLLSWDGQPVTGLAPARLQHLVAYLLLHRHVPVARRQIAFALWPDSREEQALSNLRTALYRVQHVLPDCAHCLVVERHTVAWVNGAGMQLDIAAFEQALDRASRACEPVARASALQAAVEAYTDDLLPDCYDEWIIPHRERLHQAFEQALVCLIDLQEIQHQYQGAVRNARRLLAIDPLHEGAHRTLIRLHLAAGDHVSALRAYHRCAAILRQELGIDPAPATQALHLRLLHAGDEFVPPPPSLHPLTSAPRPAPHR
jgi:DNA-binding SARP family transcriptional activator